MPKILLIEDDVELADLYKMQFEKAGFQFTYLINGLEALAKIYEDKPDLILLDIMLPGVDGLKILNELKNKEATKNIPVVILSNLPEESAKEKGLKAGAVTYLVKSNNTPLSIIDQVQHILKGQ